MKKFDASLMTEYAASESRLLGKDYWRVTVPFRFYFTHMGHAYSVDIPYGYLTDGASVPKVFQNIIGPWGIYGQACVAHDFMCEYLTIWDISVNRLIKITRESCDAIFNTMMLACEVPTAQRTSIYSAVRAYAIVAQVDSPTNMKAKRVLEASWAQFQVRSGKEIPATVHYGVAL